jgi:transposase
MRRFVPPYPAEFQKQMVELVLGGQTPAELSRQFGCSAQAICNWVAQDGRKAAAKASGKYGSLEASEREELVRLRKAVARLEQERDILAKATAWFAARNEKTSTPSTNS